MEPLAQMMDSNPRLVWSTFKPLRDEETNFLARMIEGDNIKGSPQYQLYFFALD